MSAKPFLFNLDFEPDAPPDGDAAEAPPEPAFSAEELEAARQASYADGFAAGETQGRIAAEAAITSAAEAAQTTLQAAVAQALALAEHAQQTAQSTAAIASARGLAHAFPAIAESAGADDIVRVIADALGRAHDEPRIVVRLAGADYESLSEEMNALARQAGYPGKIVVLEDAAVAPGDVRAEWAEGGLARDVAGLAHAIADALQAAAAPKTTPENHPETEAEPHV